jgi:hypothetical protein
MYGEPTSRTYGDSTKATASAVAQADAAMYHQLELLGKACESLNNRPFVCRTLVAYERLNRPLEGDNWAKNLVMKMNGQTPGE